MQVVVLGHTGFLGGSIQRDLQRKGFPVLAASSKECNLLEADQLPRFFSRISGPFQVVFCAGIARRVDDSFQSMLQNIYMVYHVACAVRERPLRSLIYLSSADVYGPHPSLPITERTPPAPANFYGLSKLCGEQLLRVSGLISCPVTIIRLPGVYGPGDAGRSIVGRFLAEMEQRGRVTVQGEGEVRRDYVEVGDVCEVVGLLLKGPYDGVLNVATGVSYTIRELIAILTEVSGLLPAVQYVSSAKPLAGDLVFEVSRLRSLLGGLRLKTLREGVQNYLISRSTGRE